MADAYGIAIQAYENGEPYAVLTVNLPSRLGNFCEMIGLKNAAYADTNNCPWIKELIEAGVAKDTGFTKQSGFCEYPLYLFDENWLKSLEPIDPNFTYDVYSMTEKFRRRETETSLFSFCVVTFRKEFPRRLSVPGCQTCIAYLTFLQ